MARWIFCCALLLTQLFGDDPAVVAAAATGSCCCSCSDLRGCHTWLGGLFEAISLEFGVKKALITTIAPEANGTRDIEEFGGKFESEEEGFLLLQELLSNRGRNSQYKSM